MRTILSLFVITSLIATGQAAIPIDTQIIAYKPVGETNEALILKRYGPSGQEEGTALPCALFFFGGGWNKGNIGHFEPQVGPLQVFGFWEVFC